MGPKKIEITSLKIYDFSSQGMTRREIAKEFGVSHVTLACQMFDDKLKYIFLSKKLLWNVLCI
jgi:hypothetical protein